jgi:hypothetical protein
MIQLVKCLIIAIIVFSLVLLVLWLVHRSGASKPRTLAGITPIETNYGFSVANRLKNFVGLNGVLGRMVRIGVAGGIWQGRWDADGGAESDFSLGEHGGAAPYGAGFSHGS